MSMNVKIVMLTKIQFVVFDFVSLCIYQHMRGMSPYVHIIDIVGCLILSADYESYLRCDIDGWKNAVLDMNI